MSKETESLRYINVLCDQIRKHAHDLLKIFDYYESAKAENNLAEQDNARWDVACGLEHWGMVHLHCYKERWDDAVQHIYIRIIEPWMIDDVPTFEERKARLNMVKVIMDRRWNGAEFNQFTKLIDILDDYAYIKTFYGWLFKHPKVKLDSFLSGKNLKEIKDWLSEVREWQRIISSIENKAEQIINPTITSKTPTDQVQAPEDKRGRIELFTLPDEKAAFKSAIQHGLVNSDLSLNQSVISNAKLAYILAVAISQEMDSSYITPDGRFHSKKFQTLWNISGEEFKTAKAKVKDTYSTRGEELIYKAYPRAKNIIEHKKG